MTPGTSADSALSTWLGALYTVDAPVAVADTDGQKASRRANPCSRAKAPGRVRQLGQDCSRAVSGTPKHPAKTAGVTHLRPKDIRGSQRRTSVFSNSSQANTRSNITTLQAMRTHHHPGRGSFRALERNPDTGAATRARAKAHQRLKGTPPSNTHNPNQDNSQ